MAKKTVGKIAALSESTFRDLKPFGSDNHEKKEIRFAIAGLGNCASGLLQGIEYSKKVIEDDIYINRLMNPSVGGYLPEHLKIVAVFEVNTLKIGKGAAEVIYDPPITIPHFVFPANYP